MGPSGLGLGGRSLNPWPTATLFQPFSYSPLFQPFNLSTFQHDLGLICTRTVSLCQMSKQPSQTSDSSLISYCRKSDDKEVLGISALVHQSSLWNDMPWNVYARFEDWWTHGAVSYNSFILGVRANEQKTTKVDEINKHASDISNAQRIVIFIGYSLRPIPFSLAFLPERTESWKRSPIATATLRSEGFRYRVRKDSSYGEL